jgi:hypothetical protein
MNCTHCQGTKGRILLKKVSWKVGEVIKTWSFKFFKCRDCQKLTKISITRMEEN